MILAIGTMDPVVQGIFFLIAVVLFVIAAVASVPKFNLMAAGLAFFAFVWMWNAFAAS